jgi:sensor histidine kinase YesM
MVENCFKHGFKSTLDKCWIRLDISVQQDWVMIKVENSIGSESSCNGQNRNGIGLENIKRRLEIIYRENYEFRTLSQGVSFFCILKIKNLLPKVLLTAV